MDSILMLGFPRAGKTTFLAALWEALEGSDEGQLRLAALPEEAGYLNEIRSVWQRCEEIRRTAVGTINRVSLRVRASENHVFDLTIPDLSGEYVREACEHRVWPHELDKLVRDAGGYLFFIHAQSPRAAQVDAVDVLQLVSSRREAGPAVPLVVVLSAWDLADQHVATPHEWLSSRMPLLSQFLRANADRFETLVVGVSAQGGDLSRAAELLQVPRPVDRIRVVSPDGSNDITAPVRWIRTRAALAN